MYELYGAYRQKADLIGPNFNPEMFIPSILQKKKKKQTKPYGRET